jgi:hypothetical protein
MVARAEKFFSDIKDHPDRFYIIHYSSQSLFDAEAGALSPRITSIGFLSGKEESEAFKAKDFIRMNTSTIAKVGFFSFVITQAVKGKLKTAGHGLLNFIDRLLESRKARLVAGISACVGLLVGLIQLVIWLLPTHS